MKIIYKDESGKLAVVIPTVEALAMFTIQEVALMSVPTGLPFKIVDDNVLPQDRTFRDAWTVDVTTLTDGVGA